ncbi:MAG: Gfo/Idh/MocA family oxidoreductase [Candidatus Marinimicrobia bacterium]|jgi:predicted dehydrogenase|nr:Gfo/Idh/MocA family oxidoreductase [Candidatus Neomarinimicrobiota bacterium]MBT3840180.1 Gfo/Idh/MocA family oxidoreductase [Candidatus Neomarinimicrobiota bacterium]MBT3999174.1 Gfo/Idh/MocA family oxidoreductase [Candidatus Neomarinimicrobiota bacterium]MBT4282610.1 Gfo/Idh/MocA family oxidoreductase [Candidatus Neomarinimicrobiota bacterium]MBT4579706.1 Gfo/Idh/MocA family oxidoreductase [Candidatus Neomarinimicrobiota bacterium]
MKLSRKLKMGLIGGGPDAFIGDIHRKAAILDGGVELVSGTFSRDIKKSGLAGECYYIDQDRVFNDYKDMIQYEISLSKKDRIDFVAITTPNNSHYQIAMDFLDAGFNVMCEKPMTFNAKEAISLRAMVNETGLVFGLMHNYSGYPMVKLARDLVRKNELGNIRKIVVQYPQGWLATPLEETGHVQAGWRTDPSKSGGAGSIGDIGTHAENLSNYITGLEITHVCADLSIMVEGRQLDDDGNCLLIFDNGAKGLIHISQIACGEENNLAIWIYGEKKSLEWHQENPNELIILDGDGPNQLWRRGNEYVAKVSPAAARATRLPSGHPEGFLEGFANIYVNFTDTIRARYLNEKPSKEMLDFPNVDDGLRGMLFIDTVLKSTKSDRKWTKIVTHN